MDNPKLVENPYYKIEEKLKNFLNYTTYDMTLFQDRVVERPWTFKEVETGELVDGNKIVYHQHYEGDIIVDGTDLSEKNLGNVDVGVAILFEWLRWIIEKLREIALKSDSLELTTLNGLIANCYVVTFFDIDPQEIIIIRGYYDKKSGVIWS